MKTIIFIAIIAFAAADPDYYDLGDLHINDLIKNPNELKTLFDCLLQVGECSKLYSPYKDITAEAVQQACKRCSPQQKQVYWIFLQAVKVMFPIEYAKYKQIYDPENKYFDDLESELQKSIIPF